LTLNPEPYTLKHKLNPTGAWRARVPIGRGGGGSVSGARGKRPRVECTRGRKPRVVPRGGGNETR